MQQPASSQSSEPLTADFDASSAHPTNTIDALLVLRAFACLMVVVIHCTPPRQGIVFRGADLSWLVFSHGAVAVWIFFCLSGYLMGKAFFSGRYGLSWQGVLNFWRNRALRIVPLYGFTILLLSILVYPEVLKLENWGTLLRLLTFTYQPSLAPQDPNFNGAVWSISTEAQFYLLVPFLYGMLCRHAKTRGRVYLTITAILLAVFSLKLLIWLPLRQQITDSMGYAFKYWYTPLATNFDVFLMGFLMNPLIQAKQKAMGRSRDGRLLAIVPKEWRSRIAQAFAVGLVIVLYLFSAHHLYHQELWAMSPTRPIEGFRTTTTIFVLQPVTALVTAYFIYTFEINAPAIPNQKLSAAVLLQNPYRILEIFGHLTYGVYLWHIPVVQKITPYFTAPRPIETFYLRLIATLLLSLILATLTYYTIELPAARRKIYRPTRPAISPP